MTRVARTHASTHDKWAERILFARWEEKHFSYKPVDVRPQFFTALINTSPCNMVIALSIILIPLFIIIVFNS